MKKLIILVGLVCLFISDVTAFAPTGARWGIRQGQYIQYVVSNELSTDIPDPECLGAVQLGYDAWTNVTCSFMSWQYDGRTENTAWGASDGENVSSWRESNWGDSSAALAITASIWGGLNNTLQDADIKYNGVHHRWAAFGQSPGRDGRTDIASVSAHEVGHALGLDHSNIAGSTMWPSTGPGDIGGRSLGADDIEGVCSLYPSGGDVPEPEVEPTPVAGTAEFGEDCSEEQCVAGLFCLNDGRDLYCSRLCEPGGEDVCGAGYHCGQLSGGGGACVRGEDPELERAAFGESCGEDMRCDRGLVCVNDAGDLYCTGPCLNDMCPSDYFCAELSNGNNICARGEATPEDELPGQGDPCTERGFCAPGLFCMRDSTNIDEETGRVIPYCTGPCDAEACPEGFRCVEVAPSGTACQLIPTAGQRNMGEDCWVNPETPWEPPTCGGDLVCVDYRIVNQQVVEKGFCTRNCSVDDCCPETWGCAEITPVFGQCRPESSDSPGFECQSDVRPGLGGGGAGGGGAGAAPGPSGDSGGCRLATGAGSVPWSLFGLLVVVFGLRRWRS